ncbi:MAG: hypothetical protein ACJA2B_001902 [Candidatus Endobugula sp.]|jgi:uncharacterized protein (DUF58 family)
MMKKSALPHTKNNQTTSFYQRWLKRRIPANKKQRLHRKNIFILPSTIGVSFLLTLLLLWLLGTNYQNNLALVLTFLLLSLMHTCMFYTYATLSGLSLEIISVDPCFLGGKARVQCRISSESGRQHQQVQLVSEEMEEAVVINVQKNVSQVVTLLMSPHYRGWYSAKRLRVFSTYPLGLLRAWSDLDMDVLLLVYPAPIESTLPDMHLPVNDATEEPDSAITITMNTFDTKEDISHLREYRMGDSPKQIAWKNYAKGQGLATKEYEDQKTAENEQWLLWDDFSGLGTETRLSRLCDCVLQAEENDMVYGLKLPNHELPLDSGIAHKEQLLRALALFNDGEPRVGGK